MTTKMTSQADAIRAALEAGRSLTPLEALNEFGCFRLGARIWDLRRAGLDIEATTVVTSGGARVASYRLSAVRVTPQQIDMFETKGAPSENA